jgi:hypothetical protein
LFGFQVDDSFRRQVNDLSLARNNGNRSSHFACGDASFEHLIDALEPLQGHSNFFGFDPGQGRCPKLEHDRQCNQQGKEHARDRGLHRNVTSVGFCWAKYSAVSNPANALKYGLSRMAIRYFAVAIRGKFVMRFHSA